MTVEIRAGDQTYRVDSAGDVDRVLDLLAATLAIPALVRLQSAVTVLHIGVGDPSASVALFLDAEGCPFFAQRIGTDRPEPGTVAFDQNGVTRQFHPHSCITPADARGAAIEFVTGRGARPTSLRWTADGGSGAGP